ncbi:DNA polymerase I [bacterium]|nr:DNA polymerase I [bacterium]
MEKERIIIIDGSGYIFRAYYAIQRLSTSQGLPTNAVYGFVNMLMKVLEDEKPTKLAIAFDVKQPSFRKELFDDYKANREKPPEDLLPQFDLIQKAVDCFGITRLQIPGFEADDVIATLADRAERDGFRTEIITGDKDLMQLVNDSITLYDTMKGVRIKREQVIEKFQVGPEQVVDILALMGDSSDNIPGVAGIGPKTAAELIQAHGSLEGIYANLGTIKQEKRRQTLIDQREMAFLSQKLATVRRDVPLELDWEALNYRGPNRPELQKLFTQLEFHGLIKRFGMEDKKDALEGAAYEVVHTPERLAEIVKELRSAKVLALDTETTSLDVQKAKCVGIALCGVAGKAYYIPVGHTLLGQPEEKQQGQMEEDKARALLKPLLEDASLPKVGQNLKYDIQILRQWGIEVRGVVGDTLLESYLIDPDQPHNLDALAMKYLGHRNIAYEEVAGSGRTQILFSEVTIDKAGQYSAEDADVTLRLHEKLNPDISKNGLQKVYHELEVPLIEVLSQMEADGILVDAAVLQRMQGELTVDMAAVEKSIYAHGGEEFNIFSPKQLSRILFEKLGLRVVKRTKTGISTDESVLTELCNDHPICEAILRYRELGKLKSTYVDGLLGQINERTGRVHTSYNQTVASTGRLSSTNPNLQNIPIGADPKYEIRSAFICPPGTELLSADYSQIELRLLAEMSQDPELVRAFANNEDVHEFTARLIFGASQVTPEQRRVAKTINFGVVYGQTPYGLSQTLKIAPGEAKKFIDTYFQRYAGVRGFLQSLAQAARESGYAVTKWGRRRFIPEINSQNRMRREMSERLAINMPLQGTAADLIKAAMISIQRRLRSEGFQTRMLLQVHDELVFEVPTAEKAKVEALVVKEMESAMTMQVPLKVSTGWGRNWQEAK